MFFLRKRDKDSPDVFVIDMKFLVILHILLIAFIAFVHWKLTVMNDF